MKTAAITVGRAAVERLSGDSPSVFRALAAATIMGGATAAITYRMLRSNLAALTAAREYRLSTDTYERRSTASMRIPGALIDGLRLTL